MLSFDFTNNYVVSPNNMYFGGLYELQEVKNITFTGLDLDTLVGASWLGVATKDFMASYEAIARKVYALDTNSVYVKGALNASTDPPYPAGEKGDIYYISAAGHVGGVSGKSVDIGSMIICINDAVTGTEAAVGANWKVMQGYNGNTIEPASDVEALNIIGTNMATASAVDIDLAARTGSTVGVIDIALGTSDIEDPEAILRITDGRNHDDAAADEYLGFTVEHSGAFPGTAASTTYLVNAEYTGTLGASGALGTLYAVRGDISGATITAGTAAAGYFNDGTQSVVAADGTNALTLVGAIGNSGSTFSTFMPVAAQQDLSGAGAINITTAYTAVTTTGADALTLVDGVVKGHYKKIQMIVDGGDGTLTPSNLSGGSTITFADVGDTAELVFDGTNWVAIALYNVTDGATAPVLA